MRDVYAVIASGPPYPALTPAVATFEDGYRANRIVEAILESAAQRRHLDEGRPVMAIKAFAPKFMKVGVLTAALQELTAREVRDADPDRAIEDWLEFAGDLGADYIQLSAALHPSQADVPPEAMLDPVANTLDLRQPFDAARAASRRSGGRQSGVRISDLAYFDNLLHDDPAIAATETRLPPARVRCGGAARR